MISITGYLEIGTNDRGEVVIDLNRVRITDSGDIVFSPNQARHLAGCLLKNADKAEGQKKSMTDNLLEDIKCKNSFSYFCKKYITNYECSMSPNQARRLFQFLSEWDKEEKS